MSVNLVVDGVRFHLDRWGDGYPLVLLHGFTGNADSWRVYDSYWRKHSRIIAIDIIGHGKSESPEEVRKYDIEVMADAIAKMLAQLQIEKVDMLGYSMGGRLALTFALKYPEKTRKLILESASPGLEHEEERVERRKQDKKLSEKIAGDGIEAFVDYWENIPLFVSQKSLPVDVRKRVREERLANSQIGLINSLLGMGTGSQPSWWNELYRIEAYLITGSLDDKFCRIAEKMTKQLKLSEWVKVDGAGHAIHVEKPEMFGTIVSGFLTK